MNFEGLATCYNNNFPTDKKTFLIRVPVIGLVLSVLSWQIITLMFFPFANDLYLIHVAYILTATAVSVELYWGLSIGDRKQFTPFVIFKFCELVTLVTSIFYIFIAKPPSVDATKYAEGVYVLAFIVFFANVFHIGYILKKYLKINVDTSKTRKHVEENIYENSEDA